MAPDCPPACRSGCCAETRADDQVAPARPSGQDMDVLMEWYVGSAAHRSERRAYTFRAHRALGRRVASQRRQPAPRRSLSSTRTTRCSRSLPPTASTPPNWRVEPAIRPAVVTRKVWAATARTGRGAGNQGRIMSVLHLRCKDPRAHRAADTPRPSPPSEGRLAVSLEFPSLTTEHSALLDRRDPASKYK